MVFSQPNNKMTEDLHFFEIEGRQIPLIVRRHPRAKRLILRPNVKGEGAIVTIPTNASSADAFDLVYRKSSWLYQQMNKMGERIYFVDGVQIPFQGAQHLVRHLENGQGLVWIRNGEINITGEVEHLSFRLAEWLKKQAYNNIIPLVHQKARRINKTVSRIVVRDTRTRWGSCSAKGALSFSWRLIMAPREILDYVVAHEVSHLVHMDHSSSFWDTVDMLSKHAKNGREWLNNNGTALHRIG